MAYVNLIKLCVGAEKVEDLQAWQDHCRQTAPTQPLRHVTRMWPKREQELLAGGSLYWVFKGLVLARQDILRLDEVIGEDEVRRCGIVLDPRIIRTQARPKRPFQGWRYLPAEDAPPDLTHQAGETATLPPALASALSDIGVLEA